MLYERNNKTAYQTESIFMTYSLLSIATLHIAHIAYGLEPDQMNYYTMPVAPLTHKRERVPSLQLLSARTITREILKNNPLNDYDPAQCFQQSLHALPDELQQLLFEQIAAHPQALARLHTQRKTFSHDHLVNSCRFSNDNRHLITVSDDPNIRIWDVASGDLLKTIITDDDFLYAIQQTHDGTRLIVAGELRMHIWSITQNALEYTIELPEPCTYLTCNDDDTLLAFRADVSRVVLWDLHARKKHRTIRYTIGRPRYFCFDSIHPGLFIKSGESLVYWNTQTGNCTKIYNIAIQPDTLLMIDPVHRMAIYRSTKEAPVNFVYLETLQMAGELPPNHGLIVTFACNHQESLLLAGLDTGTLLFFDLETRTCVKHVPLGAEVTDCLTSIDGRAWATITKDAHAVTVESVDRKITTLEALLSALAQSRNHSSASCNFS